MGIKCLSLFFIDEVAKYRQYDENGDEVLGEYGMMFEQEYLAILNEYITVFDTPYQKYLKSTCSDVSRVHKGYFSIDKKTGRSVDSKANKEGFDEKDVSAYDLILKNKERLLSFDEPTRFIFSHSALREGWDNPNVFQICTLKHSDSNTAKRQEVGRGLRLCVNQDGNRMDVQSCGDSVHEINTLTVVASESYKTFAEALHEINEYLAKKIAGDGEGATALFEVTVVGADTKETAKTLAKSIVCSNLTKAAIAGHDANWGRILCAMGYSGAQFDPEKVDLFFESKAGKIQIIENGTAVDYSEEKATEILSQEEVKAVADVKMGSESATAWGCDLTHGYIDINADYRS